MWTPMGFRLSNPIQWGSEFRVFWGQSSEFSDASVLIEDSDSFVDSPGTNIALKGLSHTGSDLFILIQNALAIMEFVVLLRTFQAEMIDTHVLMSNVKHSNDFRWLDNVFTLTVYEPIWFDFYFHCPGVYEGHWYGSHHGSYWPSLLC